MGVDSRDLRPWSHVTSTAMIADKGTVGQRCVVSTRLPAPLSSGGSERQGALRIAFVGTFPPTQCGLATFTESMVRSISPGPRPVEPVVVRLIQPKNDR